MQAMCAHVSELKLELVDIGSKALPEFVPCDVYAYLTLKALMHPSV